MADKTPHRYAPPAPPVMYTADSDRSRNLTSQRRMPYTPDTLASSGRRPSAGSPGDGGMYDPAGPVVS